MSEDKSPLFPREQKSDADRQRQLLEDAQRQLEGAEKKADFPLPHFEQNTPTPPMMVYGPPAYMNERVRPPAPMYGPPPSPITVTRSPVKLIVLIVAILAFVLGAGLALYFVFKK